MSIPLYALKIYKDNYIEIFKTCTQWCILFSGGYHFHEDGSPHKELNGLL